MKKKILSLIILFTIGQFSQILDMKNKVGVNGGRLEYGPNLVTNGTFETGTEGWAIDNPGTDQLLQSSEQAHSGTYSLKYIGESGWGSWLQDPGIPVVRGYTYRVREWVYVPEGYMFQLRIYYWEEGSNWDLSSTNWQAVAGQWNLIDTTIIAPTSGMSLETGKFSGSDGYYQYTDDVSVRRDLRYGYRSPVRTPTNVVARAINSTDIEIDWTESGIGRDSARIYYSTNGSSWTFLDHVAKDVNYYIWSGGTAYQKYYFKVQSVDQVSNLSEYSASDTATVNYIPFKSYSVNSVNTSYQYLAVNNAPIYETGSDAWTFSAWIYDATNVEGTETVAGYGGAGDFLYIKHNYYLMGFRDNNGTYTDITTNNSGAYLDVWHMYTWRMDAAGNLSAFIDGDSIAVAAGQVTLMYFYKLLTGQSVSSYNASLAGRMGECQEVTGALTQAQIQSQYDAYGNNQNMPSSYSGATLEFWYKMDCQMDYSGNGHYLTKSSSAITYSQR